MTFRSSRVRLLAVALSMGVALLALPGLAPADPTDSLSWARTYWGPADVPDYPNDPIPVAGAFNAVAFADASNGWAVGVRVLNASQIPGTKAAFVARTTTGGSTWTSATVGTVAQELRAVDAISANDVWAVGDAGTILHWNGTAWTPRHLPAQWTAGKALRSVAFADSEHGWVVGDGRGVAYTDDGGDTWSVITPPGATGTLRAVVALSATSAIAVGDSGVMRALSDEASTAGSSSTGNHLYGVTFSDDRHGWAVGANGTVVKSTDGGATWGTITPTKPLGREWDTLTMRAVAFANPYDGIIVSTYQVVWRTSDGGTTWTPSDLYDPGALGDLDLRGAAFAGSSAAPVVVARAQYESLASGANKARAYRGSWTGIPPQSPFAPGEVTVADGGAPHPRARVSWVDESADEDGFVVERATGSASGQFTTLDTVDTDVTFFIDDSVGWTSTYYYRVRSFRADLVSAWVVSGPFVGDAVAPATTSDAESAYVGSAVVTFDASDNPGGSGVEHTWSTVDGLGLLDATQRTIIGYGPHTLRFWSEDVAGNLEAVHTFDLYVADPTAPDTTAPTTTSDAQSAYAGTATITLSAADEPGGSGVATTFYTVDGGGQRTGTTVVVSGAGAHTVAFWSADLAGNVESPHKTATFTITLPAATLTVPRAPARVRHATLFNVTGFITRHPAATLAVRLYCYQRLKSGKYKWRKTVQVVISNHTSVMSKYTARFSLPSAGRWRIKAGHLADSGHRTSYSGYEYLTVY